MSRILIVEDEESIAELEKDYLELSGFEVEIENNGETGLKRGMEEDFDLLILDLMLRGVDGFEICKKIREVKNTPIIMVSAKKDDIDKIRGLGLGADDYITKPFSPKELVARIKAVMRRISPMAVEEVIEMQGLSLDPTSHRVMAGEEPLEMGPTEFKLLHFFMTHPERVYSREQLLNHVWGTNVYVEDRTVDVHIRRLRKALEPGGHDRMVQTVRGTGYRFSTRF